MEGGPQVNKFEQVSSDGYQMSLAKGADRRRVSHVCCPGRGLGPVGVSCLMSRREEGPGLGGLYSEVQCIKSNGHMGTPPVNRQTRVKTLPSRNSVDGR